MVVATDFSPGSPLALGRAALLPLAPGAEVVLVHAVRPGRESLVEEEARGRIDAEVPRVEAALAGVGASAVTVRGVVVRGGSVGAVVEAANEVGADLLIAGKRGAGGWPRTYLGSTAERLAWTAQRPVLLVGTDPPGPYARPLVALDTGPEAERILESALRVCPAPSGMELLHAWDVEFAGWIGASDPTGATLDRLRGAVRAEGATFLDDLRDRLRDAGVSVTCLLRRGDPRPTVLTACRDRRSDLVTVGTHRRGGVVGQALVGSVALAVIRSAPCDVLAVPA
ncbi:MAG: universal stress protein [Myxococcota bacterium]